MDLRRVDRGLRAPEYRHRVGAQLADADHLPVPLRSRREHGPVQCRRHHRRPVRRYGRGWAAYGLVCDVC